MGAITALAILLFLGLLVIVFYPQILSDLSTGIESTTTTGNPTCRFLAVEENLNPDHPETFGTTSEFYACGSGLDQSALEVIFDKNDNVIDRNEVGCYDLFISSFSEEEGSFEMVLSESVFSIYVSRGLCPQYSPIR